MKNTSRRLLAGVGVVGASALLACSINEDLGTASMGKLASALAAGAPHTEGGQES